MSYFQWRVGSTNYNPDSVKFENGVYVSSINVHKDTHGSQNVMLWHKGVYFNGDTTQASNFWESYPGAWRTEYTKNNAAFPDGTIQTISSNGGLPLWYNSELKKFCSNQSSDRVTLSEDFVRNGGFALAPKNHARLFYNFQQPQAYNNISNCWIQQYGWDGTYNYSEMFYNANYAYGTSLHFPKVIKANFYNAFARAKLYNGIILNSNSTLLNAAGMFNNYKADRYSSGVQSFAWVTPVIRNSPDCNYVGMFENFSFTYAGEYQGRWPGWFAFGDSSHLWSCPTARMFNNCKADSGEQVDLYLYFNGGDHTSMFNGFNICSLSMKGGRLDGTWSNAFANCRFADHVEYTIHSGSHTGCFRNASVWAVNYGYINNTGAYYMFEGSTISTYHSGTQFDFNISDCERMFNNCRNLRYFGSWFSTSPDIWDGHDCEGFDISTNYTCHMFENTQYTMQYANQGHYYWQDMILSAVNYADSSKYSKTMTEYVSWRGLAYGGRGYIYLYNPGFSAIASYSNYDKVKYWLNSFVGVAPVSSGSMSNRYDIHGGSLYLVGTATSPKISASGEQITVSIMDDSKYAPKYGRVLRYSMTLEENPDD